MAIKFSGEFTSPRTPDEVYDFLCDPNKFGPLLPDFESMSVQDATHFTVKVRAGVGNIRGSAEIKMELAEAVRPQRALYKGRGSAVGSQITVSAEFDLFPLPDSTRIAWEGEAGVFGKLASMAGGMLEPLGKKNIQKLIDGLQWALKRPPAQVVAPEAAQLTLADSQQQPTAQAASVTGLENATAAPQPDTGEVSGEGLSSAVVQTARPSTDQVSSGSSPGVANEPALNPPADELSGAGTAVARERDSQHTTGEAPVAGSPSATAQQTGIAEGPNTGQEPSPKGGTNLAQDVSPG